MYKKVLAALFAGLVVLTGFVVSAEPAEAQCGNGWQARKQYRKMQRRAWRNQQCNGFGVNMLANPYMNTAMYPNPYVNPYVPFNNGMGFAPGLGSGVLGGLFGLF